MSPVRRKTPKKETMDDLRSVAENLMEETQDKAHDVARKNQEEIIHELQVHQIELELQNEELKKAHLALEKSRDEYINLYDFAPIGYFTLSKEALISQVNLTGAEFLGITRMKLINTRFRRFVHPEMHDLWDRFFLLLLSQDSKQITTLLLKRNDGNMIHTRIEGVREKNEDGWYELRLAINDISDLKRAEYKLMEANRYHRGLIEASVDPFLTIGLDGKITDLNSATERITGYSREELTGSDFTRFFIIKGQSLEDYQSIFRVGKIQDCYLEIQKKDRIIIPALCNASVFTDNDGHIQGAFAVVRDITEIMQKESALHEAIQKLRLLTSLTRHDIFNQLSIVRISHDLLLDTSDPAEIQKFISMATEAENRIEKIIGFTREFEDFGDLSSGWQKIHAIIEFAKLEVSPGDLQIENKVYDDLEVYSDPIIRKVFVTLMENAIRHGKNVSEVVFYSKERDENLILICQDNGVGIPESEKERIFEHGYGKHTGIGLFLSREVLSITGLSISECGVEGEGARFEIMVPAGKYRFTRGGMK